MSPEEMLLDPPATRLDEQDAPTERHGRIAAAPEPGPEPAAPDVVPPVRTIVLDRAPVPAPPPSERVSVRTALAGAGPERLRLEEVSIDYGPKQAVKQVSLSIHQGEVLALIGPSGCGKTTLLRTLNRLTELTPSARRGGRIMLDGEDVHAIPDTKLRARVAMVFQQPNPFPMSIFDNVAFGLREQSRKRPGRRVLEPLVIEALRRAGCGAAGAHDRARPHAAARFAAERARVGSHVAGGRRP